MSNGDSSPKFGSRAFNAFCQLDFPISKIRLSVKDRRLVGINLYSANEEEPFLKIHGTEMVQNSADVILDTQESLIGFNVRVDKSQVQGIGFKILS